MTKVDDAVTFVVESNRNGAEDTDIMENLAASGLSEKEIQNVLAQANKVLGV